ncbi:hypothetical protein KI387_033157, partial [Taxus chinensis]
DAQEGQKFDAQKQEALETVFSFVPALVLKSALLLEIPDIIARHGGNASLSVHQIASCLPTDKPHLDYLSRILRYLSTKGVFIQSQVADELQYSLTDTAKLFFVKEKNPCSLVPVALMQTHEVLMARWNHLHESVLEGCNPFEKAHGKNLYACCKDDPYLNIIVNDRMTSNTLTKIDQIVHFYDGFRELKSIVDVGGGKGTALGGIVKAYPHIHGINFDLPHVIATAPLIPGIEHVGGSMFDSIPSANAVFIKNVLVDWDDESCMKLLQNCHKALPENGKVIIVEETTADPMEQSELLNVIMIARVNALRMRSEQELRWLLQSSSFSILKIVRLRSMMIIEATKLNAM